MLLRPFEGRHQKSKILQKIFCFSKQLTTSCLQALFQWMKAVWYFLCRHYFKYQLTISKCINKVRFIWPICSNESIEQFWNLTIKSFRTKFDLKTILTKKYFFPVSLHVKMLKFPGFTNITLELYDWDYSWVTLWLALQVKLYFHITVESAYSW